MPAKWADPGTFRKRIQFLSLSTTPDSFGQPQATWTAYYTCWGAIDILRGQMLYNPSEFVAQTMYMVTCRYPGTTVTINPKDIMVADGQTYEIQVVEDVNKQHRQLQIVAYQLNQGE